MEGSYARNKLKKTKKKKKTTKNYIFGVANGLQSDVDPRKKSYQSTEIRSFEQTTRFHPYPPPPAVDILWFFEKILIVKDVLHCL